MTTSLVDKYQQEWDTLLSNYSATLFYDEKPTNPLLLDIPSGYFAADWKVMIFGQETNDWEGLFPHENGVAHLLKTYSDFYNSNYCYSPYDGQFWNGVSKIKKALAEKLKDSGKATSVIWNNLIKIGKAKAKGAPSEAILKFEDAWFDVISFEISVLKPNIVIFLSGPNYDKYINRIFSDVSFESINERGKRQLARVKSNRLPIDSIRTYHPNYLWRNGFYNYLDEIVGAISC